MSWVRVLTTAAVVAAASITTGCASAAGAYTSAPALAVEEGGANGFVFDDVPVADLFQREEQLRFPVRLAVVGIEQNIHGTFGDPASHQFEQALADSRETFSDVMPLPQFLDRGSAMEVTALRRSAARTKADALLLYRQRVHVDEERNALSVLNLTVVGLVIVPSVDIDVRLESHAALVDVRHGLVYTTARDVREGHVAATSAGAEGAAKDLKRELREASFAALRDSLEEKVARIRERAEARQ